MNSELSRFPSLRRRISVAAEVSRDLSNDGQSTEASTAQTLSRFPSLSSTRAPTITQSSYTYFSQNGESDLNISSKGSAWSVDQQPTFTSSIYGPLPLPQGYFTRLLCLRPGLSASPSIGTLFVADIDTYRDKFIALSYVWGPDDNSAPIFVNGRLQRIRRSLHNFLRALRHPQRQILIWADAICIDQQSNLEKNHQIKLMHKIFSAASCTRAWLGDDMPIVTQAIKDFRASRHSTGEAATTVKAWAAIDLLLPLINHEYWVTRPVYGDVQFEYT